MSVRVGSTIIAGSIEVDSTISSSSSNPVASSTLYTALENKQNALSQGTNITIDNDIISTPAAKVIIRRFL